MRLFSLAIMIALWVGFGTANAADYVTISLDESSLVMASTRPSDIQPAGYRRNWFVFISKDYNNAGQKVYFTNSLQEFDCLRHRVRSIMGVDYGASGRTIQTISSPSDWSYVIPGSVGEYMQEYVCGTVAARRALTQEGILRDVDLVALSQNMNREWPSTQAGVSRPVLSACDSSSLQQSMIGSLQSQGHITVTEFRNTVTVSRNSDSATCTTHAVLSDGREVDYTYTLSLDGNSTGFLITDAVISNSEN